MRHAVVRKLPEPDDVDFSIGEVQPEPLASIETKKAIEEYRRRPIYKVEAEEAERILAEIGIDYRGHGMNDAKTLLESWQKRIAELPEANPHDLDGTRVMAIRTPARCEEPGGVSGCSLPPRLLDERGAVVLQFQERRAVQVHHVAGVVGCNRDILAKTGSSPNPARECSTAR